MRSLIGKRIDKRGIFPEIALLREPITTELTFTAKARDPVWEFDIDVI